LAIVVTYRFHGFSYRNLKPNQLILPIRVSTDDEALGPWLASPPTDNILGNFMVTNMGVITRKEERKGDRQKGVLMRILNMKACIIAVKPGLDIKTKWFITPK